MAEKRKWIKAAIKHPGALHRELGVKADDKIPAAKMKKAAHSDDPTERERAELAETLKGMHHKAASRYHSRTVVRP